jgi:hypothetical protein
MKKKLLCIAMLCAHSTSNAVDLPNSLLNTNYASEFTFKDNAEQKQSETIEQLKLLLQALKKENETLKEINNDMVIRNDQLKNDLFYCLVTCCLTSIGVTLISKSLTVAHIYLTRTVR